MPEVGFIPTIPVFERDKTVHVSDFAATVIGMIKVVIIIVIIKSINNLDYKAIYMHLHG
jgi:hypothetical protein